jgi:nitrogen fixation/metabolism regulation signal transduction histidine kinase
MTPQIIIRKLKEPFVKIIKVTLRTKLMVAFFLIVFICLGVVFALSLRVITARFDEMAKERIQDALRSIASELQTTGEEVTGKLERIGQIAELKRKMLVTYGGAGIDYLGLSNQLIDLMRSTGVDILEITDRNGKVIASAHDTGRIGQVKPADSFLQTALSGKNVQGISVESLVSGNYLALKSSVPIYYRNEIIGVLTGGYIINPEFLQKLKRVSAVELGLVRGNTLELSTVADVQGRPIPQMQFSAEFLSAIRSSKAALYIKRMNLNQTEFSIGGMPLVTDGKSVGILLVAVSQEKSRLTVAELRRNFIGFGLFGMLLALFVAFFLARKITAPIQKLADGSVAIAAGDYDQQIAVTSKDELGMLVSTFNYMAKELRENREKLIAAMRLAEWQEVARRIAHEIMNPLSSIQLSIQNLQQSQIQKKDDFSEVFQESTQTILEEVENLSKIVKGFSEFAKMPKPFKEWIELPEVLESTVALYASGQEKIKFEVAIAEQIPKIFADPEQLRRAFSNLIKNAIDAMPNGGKLSIAVSATTMKEDTAIQVSFADTGEGMSPETIKKLFLPYFSTKKKGTGLGLSMVERIISDHSGTITVTSEIDKGSTFTLIIPVNYEEISEAKE